MSKLHDRVWISIWKGKYFKVSGCCIQAKASLALQKNLLTTYATYLDFPFASVLAFKPVSFEGFEAGNI